VELELKVGVESEVGLEPGGVVIWVGLVISSGLGCRIFNCALIERIFLEVKSYICKQIHVSLYIVCFNFEPCMCVAGNIITQWGWPRVSI